MDIHQKHELNTLVSLSFNPCHPFSFAEILPMRPKERSLSVAADQCLLKIHQYWDDLKEHARSGYINEDAGYTEN